jgi:hypothetical protein
MEVLLTVPWMVMTPPPALVEETVPKVLLLRAGLPVMGADYLKVLGVAMREEGGIFRAFFNLSHIYCDD